MVVLLYADDESARPVPVIGSVAQPMKPSVFSAVFGVGVGVAIEEEVCVLDEAFRLLDETITPVLVTLAEAALELDGAVVTTVVIAPPTVMDKRYGDVSTRAPAALVPLPGVTSS